MPSLPKYSQLEAHRTPGVKKVESTKTLERDIENMDITPSRPVKRRVSSDNVFLKKSIFQKLQILKFLNSTF